MTFIQMTDLRGYAQLIQQPPSANAQHNLLHDPHFRSSAICLAADLPVFGQIGRIIGVEQIQLYPTHHDLPGS